MEGWDGLVGLPMAKTLPKSGHLSTIDQAQIRESSPKTDVLTTEPRRHHINTYYSYIAQKAE